MARKQPEIRTLGGQQQAMSAAGDVAPGPRSYEEVTAAIASVEGPPRERTAPYGSAAYVAIHEKRQGIFNAAREKDWDRVQALLAAYASWLPRIRAWSERQWRREGEFMRWEADNSGRESSVLRDGGAGTYDESASRADKRRELGLDEAPPLD